MDWIKQKEKNKDYKGFVGNPKHYDLIGKIVFELLLNCGLKPEHKLLDMGCGSLRIGKYLIQYLNDYNYFGIEPNKWLIESRYKDINLLRKNYSINYNNQFDLQCFNEKFDFILANSIFVHASQLQTNKCISQIPLVLKNNGKFIFSFIAGKENNKNKNWTYPQAVKYKKIYIERLLEKYNLKYKYLDVKYPGKQIFMEVKNVNNSTA